MVSVQLINMLIIDFYGRIFGKYNTAKQAHILLLEEWLRSNSGGSSSILSKGSSSSVRAIIQAWYDVRDHLEHKSFGPHHLQLLKTLLNSHASLYLADPQAKVLLSILSFTNISLPPETYPLFLRLLYIWIRKSSKPSPVLIDSADPYASFCEGWYIQSNGCFLLSQSFFKTTILAVDMEALQLTGVYCTWSLGAPMTTWAKIYGSNVSLRSLSWKPISFKPFLVGNHVPQKGRVQVVSPNRASPSFSS
ncbi:hypothetical protein Vadar_007971 [Vaccinium darrowii]|uniref:Uncharacterized protein n=1 Tax=Vaccinium darrowii TaxID=229202 RepID=A0ACB7XG52_9ERIC|nr:hypothetical protein Vadar_007971 [Vaccinium darrowii]